GGSAHVDTCYYVKAVAVELKVEA
ncbi:MAG: hypothetical protein QG572_910, partial [Pseudomonadota bacterium]|nr:hypothetical protein [Pseudomonadota bacterium]